MNQAAAAAAAAAAAFSFSKASFYPIPLVTEILTPPFRIKRAIVLPLLIPPEEEREWRERKRE